MKLMNRFLTCSTMCWAFVLVCLGFQGTAFAFDGNRAGFILGLGAGGGYARESGRWSYSGFAGKTDFLIGYAPSNRLAITYSNKVFWYKNSDLVVANATGGLGITYFLSENINANFIQAVIGFNSNVAPFEDDARTFTGFGLGIGVGREISKNWIIGVGATWGRPVSGATTLGIGVYFSHIWY